MEYYAILAVSVQPSHYAHDYALGHSILACSLRNQDTNVSVVAHRYWVGLTLMRRGLARKMAPRIPTPQMTTAVAPSMMSSIPPAK